MPNINLIAQKRHDKLVLERNVRRMFFLASGLLIAAIVLFTMLSARWFALTYKTNDLKDELAKLEPTVDRIKQYDAKTAALAPKIELYSKARDHTLRWYTYLQVVARSLPQDAWLTRIYPAQGSRSSSSSSTSSKGATVNLAGITLSQQLVGDTMLKLASYSDLMDRVDLHFTQNSSSGDVPTVEFEVATNIKDMPAIFDDKPEPKRSSASGKGGTDANEAKS